MPRKKATTRTCTKCGKRKNLAKSFYKNAHGAEGYLARCKPCHYAAVRASLLKRREKKARK